MRYPNPHDMFKTKERVKQQERRMNYYNQSGPMVSPPMGNQSVNLINALRSYRWPEDYIGSLLGMIESTGLTESTYGPIIDNALRHFGDVYQQFNYIQGSLQEIILQLRHQNSGFQQVGLLGAGSTGNIQPNIINSNSTRLTNNNRDNMVPGPKETDTDRRFRSSHQLEEVKEEKMETKPKTVDTKPKTVEDFRVVHSVDDLKQLTGELKARKRAVKPEEIFDIRGTVYSERNVHDVVDMVTHYALENKPDAVVIKSNTVNPIISITMPEDEEFDMGMFEVGGDLNQLASNIKYGLGYYKSRTALAIIRAVDEYLAKAITIAVNICGVPATAHNFYDTYQQCKSIITSRESIANNVTVFDNIITGLFDTLDFTREESNVYVYENQYMTMVARLSIELGLHNIKPDVVYKLELHADNGFLNSLSMMATDNDMISCIVTVDADRYRSIVVTDSDIDGTYIVKM